MADYFNAGENENTNGATAITNGDAAMDDEISVSFNVAFYSFLKTNCSQ